MVHLFINAAINSAVRNYLDPGSGSMLIQLILGAVLGLGVVVRVFWKNIKEFFNKSKGQTIEAFDPTAIDEDPTQAGNKTQWENPTDKTH